ncbi:MAG: single-stranded-DNA-specific exonuclease RecJ [Pseudomonadota bacterium]
MQIERRKKQNSYSFDQFHPVVNRVMQARALSSPQELDYGLSGLLPPTKLHAIDDAAHLLAEAVMAQANIVIVGDFDADGATSVAVAMRALRGFGLEQVSYIVPNRFEYGYGLTPEIVGVAAISQPDVIVTVDNGISSINGVHAAQALGISVLITDHHLPGESLPTAEVIVNPNLQQDKFPSKNLAGVGVIFYVMSAVRALLRRQGWFESMGIAPPKLSDLLDLVALGTVADVVPLDRNNRILVHQGIARIRASRASAGVAALIEVAGRQAENLVASDLGYVVGPRLNAAGRLDDISIGIECLLSDDFEQAKGLANQLDTLNNERKAVQHSMQQQALAVVGELEAVDAIEQRPIHVLFDESWHQGVIGLVAAKVKERTARPVIAMAPGEQDGTWKGSARSVKGLHIRDLLARFDALHPGILAKYGGHAMAAGFSISEEHLADFPAQMQAVMRDFSRGHDWETRLFTDGAIEADEFSLELAAQLRECSPWGQHFTEPCFDGEFRVVNSRRVGEDHLKLVLAPLNSNIELDAICFGYFSQESVVSERIPTSVRAVYRLDINEFRGVQSLQLIISHLESV